ncbi:hypothetical protein [Robiginitalea biformata]|uniref:Late embryogenesis abundant protein LEA-2 subgroup domain-containing protein n=1 Tax=Robiginitalea biformata (strain ATCC BAA-864 / DSM 15991 / KCTC 12146 / HTCC2501) TaxID=313596 RepID=A4CKQ6_ROBBH|nr:hypothetical protein [Robiginitalea biformata]EAR15455.1 hypothetical protein RB2501_14044 [Robiginitalea biformata HTCC2501]
MKKWLIISGIGVTALALFGASKGASFKRALESLQVSLSRIRNLRLRPDGIYATIDVRMTNPTDKLLDIMTAGIIKVTRIFIYDKSGSLVATASPNIDTITIRPQGSTILKDVPINANYGGVLNTLISGTNPDDYRVEAEIEAFGTTIKV